MAQHWEESTINIEHIGQQNLQQRQPYRPYDNRYRGITDPSTLATMMAYVNKQKELMKSMNNSR